MEEHTVCVVYTAKPGMREAFVERIAASGLLEIIRAEEGCLAYDYYLSEDDEARIMLVERWLSQAHQQTHLGQPHMDELRAIKDLYIAHTEFV